MEIKNITFAYQDKITRLHNIDTDIKKGEITTIIGPNGSGKSTLLSVMTNNNQPQQGKILLEGKGINEYKPKELAQTLGVVHQQNSAPSDMTVVMLAEYARFTYMRTYSRH